MTNSSINMTVISFLVFGWTSVSINAMDGYDI